jgi:uncharacterized membrane protein YoaK (UPF0700 family)
MPVRARVVLLAVGAGAVDAIVFLSLFHIFTAHLSGDTTRLAIEVGRGDLHADALARVIVILAFFLGVIVGVAALTASSRRTRALLVAELVCLGGLMVVGAATRHEVGFGDVLFFALVGIAALAMGLQSALVRRTAGTSVHTTFVTGMITAVGEDAVAWWHDRTDVAARARLGLHSSIWLAYLTGGIVGTAAQLQWAFWALAIPLAILLVVLLDDARRPLATEV